MCDWVFMCVSVWERKSVYVCGCVCVFVCVCVCVCVALFHVMLPTQKCSLRMSDACNIPTPKGCQLLLYPWCSVKWNGIRAGSWFVDIYVFTWCKLLIFLLQRLENWKCLSHQKQCCEDRWVLLQDSRCRSMAFVYLDTDCVIVHHVFICFFAWLVFVDNDTGNLQSVYTVAQTTEQ